ncbi:MAG TPA: hypothetical protein VMD02_03535 [Candidatus Omnitrophota bacterium]|nr:hypothetical protein [Candidatus Omnitrophota bacterium]
MKNITVLILVAACLFGYVLVFTPAVPIGDQWELVPLLKSVDLNGLVAQHNEHRIFFPRLIFLALAHLSRWNMRCETAVGWLLFVMLMFAIWAKFSRQFTDPAARAVFMALLVAEFSPVHNNNLLWGWQVQIMLSVLCMFIAFSSGLASGKEPRSLTAAIASLVIASFSFLSGLFGWFITLFAMVRSGAVRALNAALFVAAGALTFFLYFRGFNRVVPPAETAVPLAHKLWQVPAYFIVYMGANFIPTHKLGKFLVPVLWLSGIWGAILLAAGLYYVVRTWKYRPEETVLPQCLMLLGLFSAFSTAFGRIDYGLSFALISRYHIFQMCYLIGLAWLFLLETVKAGKLEAYRKPLVALLLALALINWVGGIGLGILKMRKTDRVVTELIQKEDKISESSALVIYPNPAVLRNRIKMLKEVKYNVFQTKGAAGSEK